MSLLEEIEKCWTEDEVELAEKWANALVKNKDKVIKAGKEFHEWDPLRAYLSVTRAVNPSMVFSLRYQGQEVASLAIDGKERQLIIPPKTAQTNTSDFGVSTVGEFRWESKEARKFRKEFRTATDKTEKVTEHRIESEFLKQMAIGASSKFKGTLKNIQPVLFASFPLQFPLPLSGNTGEPKSTRGNIDILARRGTGKGTKISIWELKKPNATAHAIEQAYIYAATLIKMLRSKSGETWYKKIIGFNGKLPDKLTIESVIAVSFTGEKKKTDFVEKLEKFKKKNEFQIGNDTIKLYVAHYRYEPNKNGTPLIIENAPFEE